MKRHLMFPLMLLTIVVIALAATCGDDDDDDGGGEEVNVCDQRQSVDQAVQDLADLDVLSEGTSALEDSVQNVKTELEELRTVVSSDVQDEVDAFAAAVDDAEETLANIEGEEGLNAKIDEVQRVLTAVATTGSALYEGLAQECG